MRTLFSFFRSSASWRVRAALVSKGLPFDLETRNLRKQEQRQSSYLDLNPQGLVPTFVDDGLVLTQSLAIIEYLDERYPNPPLLPPDSPGRAVVRAMAQVVTSDINPIVNLRVLEYLRGRLGQDEDGVALWYQHWVAEGFSALEELVLRHGNGRHCFGETLTMADLCLVPQMSNARRFDCDVTPYPTLVSIDAHLSSLEPFAATRPEAQPDAV